MRERPSHRNLARAVFSAIPRRRADGASPATGYWEGLEPRLLMAAHVSVTFNSAPYPDDGPAVDYGTVTVGQAAPTKSFTLTNDGTVPVDLTDDTGAGGIPIFNNVAFPTHLEVGEVKTLTVALLTATARTSDFGGVISFEYADPTDSSSSPTVFRINATGQVLPSPTADFTEPSPTFMDKGSVKLTVGMDGAGNRPSDLTLRTLLFHVAALSDVNLSVTPTLTGGSAADLQVLVLADQTPDGALSQAELSAPMLSRVATPGGGTQVYALPARAAGGYFVRLGVTNAIDPGSGQGTAQVDYQLAVTTTAVPLPGVAVTGGGAAIADGDATPGSTDGTDFGTVGQGGTEVERTFTVTNTGGSALTLGGVAASGGFEVVSGLPASLAAGAHADFKVGLTTTAAGTKSGQVSFTTNAAGKNPFNFAVSGVVSASPTPTGPTPTPTGPTPTPTGPTPTPTGPTPTPTGPTPTPTGPTPTPTGPTPTPTTPTPTDVSITGATDAVPTSVVAGQKTAKGTVTVTLNNTTADTFAGPVTLTVRATAGGATADVGSLTKTVKLKAGASKSLKVKVVIPASVADGDYQLSAVASGTTVAATFAVGALHVEQPRVDLAGLVGAGNPLSLTVGRPAKLTVPLTNRGNVLAKGSVTVDLAAASPSDPPLVIPLGSASGKLSLKAGASGSLKLKFLVPASLPAGSYTLTVLLTSSSLGAANAVVGTSLASIPITVI